MACQHIWFYFLPKFKGIKGTLLSTPELKPHHQIVGYYMAAGDTDNVF